MKASALTTRIDLVKESFKFASGHFTIFSATSRENIHGHNFKVQVAFDAVLPENGMIFDYKVVKNYVQELCDSLDEYFLLPAHSPYLTITESDGYVFAHFAGEKIPFLKRDIKILPVSNITVEELSRYLLEKFVGEFVENYKTQIFTAEVRVFSGDGQSATSRWQQ